MHTAHAADGFFGQRNFSANLGGLQLLETRYDGATVIPSHEHGRRYLCIVLGGAYEERSASGNVMAAAGSILSHPEGHRHSNRFAEAGGHCLNVIPGGAWQHDPHWQRGLSMPRHVRAGSAAEPIARLRRELRYRDDISTLAISAAVLDLLAITCRQISATTAPHWLPRVLELLASDVVNPPSMESLGVEAGVHPSHLSRVFRRHTGKSVGDYLRGRRLEIALGNLARTRDPMAVVAQAAGYADQAHMSRHVRSATGLTPTAYRAMRANVQGRFKSA